MWYISLAAVIENNFITELLEDSERQILLKISGYRIYFCKQDKGRVLIEGILPNRTFLDSIIESKEDFIKFLTQLGIL